MSKFLPLYLRNILSNSTNTLISKDTLKNIPSLHVESNGIVAIIDISGMTYLYIYIRL